MSSSARPEPVVTNTTPLRYFALVDQIDILASTVGGRILVARQVFDPDEPVDALGRLLSEIGRSEAHWAARSAGNPEATENWSRLMALRKRDDIEIVDLTDEELEVYAELISPEFARSMGLAGTLGPGEGAVMAIAEARDWEAALDEAAARRVLEHRSPATSIVTTMELLRRAVGAGLLTSPQAQNVYRDMLTKGYRGPDSLW